MESITLRSQLSSLNEVNQALTECQSIEEAVQKALNEVRKKLNVQVASIFLFSNEGVIKRVGINGIDRDGKRIGNDWFSDEHYKPGESFSGKAVPFTGLEFGFGEPQYSNNILEEYSGMNNGSLYETKLGDLRCGISVPLNGLNRTFGTLEVLNSQSPNGFTSDDLYWLMLIGTNLANCISTFRRKEKQKLVNYIIENFISLAVIDNNFNLEEVCQFIADALVNILSGFSDITTFKACIIRLVDENEDLEIKAKSHPSDVSWQGRKDGSIKAGSLIVGEVYKTNKPRFIIDVSSEIDKFNNKTWIEANDLKSFTCLPLSVGDKCVGTISIYTKHRYYFFDSNKYFLEGIAFLTAAIIGRVRVVNELRRIRRELRLEQGKVINASLLVGYDSLLRGILHQYKNELIDFYQVLETLSSGNKSRRDKDSIIRKKLHWINSRVSEIQTEFRQDEAVPVDINELVRDAVRLILFEEKSKVAESYENNIPIISIDESKIRNVICNILSNALVSVSKSNRKMGQISIATDVVTLDCIKHIQVSIEDDGVGIPNENREKVFEKGFTTRKIEGGTGLGLYIAREIIKDHGGKLYFESKVGKGTTFFVQIPLKRYLMRSL